MKKDLAPHPRPGRNVSFARIKQDTTTKSIGITDFEGFERQERQPIRGKDRGETRKEYPEFTHRRPVERRKGKKATPAHQGKIYPSTQPATLSSAYAAHPGKGRYRFPLRCTLALLARLRPSFSTLAAPRENFSPRATREKTAKAAFPTGGLSRAVGVLCRRGAKRSEE